ncbi:hypothetical protein ECPA49_5824, partial [Escherichia coli PA49]
SLRFMLKSDFIIKN